MGTNPGGSVDSTAAAEPHTPRPEEGSPAWLLANLNVLTPHQFAVAAGLYKVHGDNKGAPNARRARDLLRSGAVRLVDPNQPATRWTVCTEEAWRYITEGPRVVTP